MSVLAEGLYCEVSPLKSNRWAGLTTLVWILNGRVVGNQAGRTAANRANAPDYAVYRRPASFRSLPAYVFYQAPQRF